MRLSLIIILSICAVKGAILQSTVAINEMEYETTTEQIEANDAIAENTNTTLPSPTEQSFITGFLSALSIVFSTEALDKTFFIAVVMAMRHSSDHRSSDDVHSSVELREMSDANREIEGGNDDDIPIPTTTAPNDHTTPNQMSAFRSFLTVSTETFLLTFLAEWGDRSQVATVLLAATENVLAVAAGGVVGHGICTGAAVLGGKFIANHVTMKTVTLLGGAVFAVLSVLTIVLYKNESA